MVASWHVQRIMIVRLSRRNPLWRFPKDSCCDACQSNPFCGAFQRIPAVRLSNRIVLWRLQKDS
eukprot:3481788-Pyramimonas_sp.AAC.1